MPKKALFVAAAILAVALSVTFLGNLAIRIGEIPLMIIVFGVLGMMVWDFIDTVRNNVRASEAAENERPDAERIARADQLLVGEGDKRVSAFNLAQRIDEAVHDAGILAARHKLKDRLGVGGGLENRARADEFVAQRDGVGQIAVMRDGEAAAPEIGEKRLHVAQDRFARRRVADMADGGVAGQPVHHLLAGEVVADEAETALGVKVLAVEADDARRFLAAMLECMEAESRQRGGVGMAEDAEHAAFLAQPVAVKLVVADEPGQGGSGVSVRVSAACHAVRSRGRGWKKLELLLRHPMAPNGILRVTPRSCSRIAGRDPSVRRSYSLRPYPCQRPN